MKRLITVNDEAVKQAVDSAKYVRVFIEDADLWIHVWNGSLTVNVFLNWSNVNCYTLPDDEPDDLDRVMEDWHGYEMETRDD